MIGKPPNLDGSCPENKATPVPLTRHTDGDEELYDRQADPHDWYNLADQTEYADQLAGYRAKRFFPDKTAAPHDIP